MLWHHGWLSLPVFFDDAFLAVKSSNISMPPMALTVQVHIFCTHAFGQCVSRKKNTPNKYRLNMKEPCFTSWTKTYKPQQCY